MKEVNIEELKSKHGTVYTLTVEDSKGKEITVYLKEMDRVAFKAISSFMQKDEITGTESMLKSLYVGGDDINLIIGDLQAIRNAGVTMLPILQTKTGELKKN